MLDQDCLSLISCGLCHPMVEGKHLVANIKSYVSLGVFGRFTFGGGGRVINFQNWHRAPGTLAEPENSGKWLHSCL